MIKVRALVLVLPLLLLSGAGCSALDKPEIGACVKATGSGAKTTTFEELDCGSPEAAYRVVSEGPDCGTSTNGYWSHDTGKGRGTRSCLTLNAQVGDCFHQEIGFPTGKAAKLACGPGATYRVIAVHEGAADAAVCGPEVRSPVGNDLSGRLALVYRQPPLTLCTAGV